MTKDDQNVDLDDVNKILEKSKKDLENAAASSIRSEAEKEAAKKLAIEQTVNAKKAEDAKAAIEVEKQKLEEEKKKLETDAATTKTQQETDAEALKRKTIEELAKADLELKLKEKDEEIKAMSGRLQIIEDERKARREEEHYNRVNVLVNKMVKSKLLDSEAAEAKFESLKGLDNDALNEVYAIVDKKFEEMTNEDTKVSQRETIPSTDLKHDSNDNNENKEKKSPVKLSPIEEAFAKLKQKQTQPGPSGAGFF